MTAEEKDAVKGMLKQLMPDQYPDGFADHLVDDFYDSVMAGSGTTGNPDLDALLVRLGNRAVRR